MHFVDANIAQRTAVKQTALSAFVRRHLRSAGLSIYIPTRLARWQRMSLCAQRYGGQLVSPDPEIDARPFVERIIRKG